MHGLAGQAEADIQLTTHAYVDHVTAVLPPITYCVKQPSAPLLCVGAGNTGNVFLKRRANIKDELSRLEISPGKQEISHSGEENIRAGYKST